MIGIVVITHGSFSKELIETVKLIMGEQKDLVAITLNAKDSLDTLREKAVQEINAFKDSGCLVLTDLVGGSPTNVCMEFIKTDWARVVCGVNLPMIMAALQSRDKVDLPTLVTRTRDGAIKGIIDLKAFYEERAKKKGP